MFLCSASSSKARIKELHLPLLILCIISFSLCSGDGETTFDVFNFGAKGDGITNDSQAFLDAWGALCAATAGAAGAPPTLIIPSNTTFLLQPVTFQGPCKSNVIHVQLLGNVVAPNTLDEWENCGTLEQWLGFNDVDGLIIDGSGQIDGRGSPFWNLTDVLLKNCSKPRALKFQQCNNLQIIGTTHVDSPKNHISIDGSENVTLSNLTIKAPSDSPNTDGIDIAASTNITIKDSVIGTGDDCIAMNNGTVMVNITGLSCGPGHGISVGSLGGSESMEFAAEIHVSNCTFNGTQNGARIKTKQAGIGHVKNISFEYITFIDTKNPIIIDQNYMGHGQCQDKFKVSNVTYRNMQGSSALEIAIKLDCCNIGCDNIFMHQINITSSDPAKNTSAMCSNVTGISTFSTSPAVPCLFNY